MIRYNYVQLTIIYILNKNIHVHLERSIKMFLRRETSYTTLLSEDFTNSETL